MCLSRRTSSQETENEYFITQSLFANLDKLLAPDRPCHSSLWIAILAFHKALSDQPRSSVVVAAFGLAVHNGGDILEAVKITKKITRPHDSSFFELVEEPEENIDFQTLLDEIMDLDASVKDALNQMTDGYFISKAMAAYPQAPFSDLVFIPLQLYLRAGRIFQCVKEETQVGFEAKQGSKIEYTALYSGDIQEIRHVFARVVFDTVFPSNLIQEL